jgi:hypothetical protein
MPPITLDDFALAPKSGRRGLDGGGILPMLKFFTYKL